MSRLTALLFAAVPLFAHVMSMSTGDLTVSGNRARYQLNMPLYEIAHVKSPQTALFGAIRFSTAGQPARMSGASCVEDPARGAYLCTADYEFPLPVGRLEVDCTFHSVTVPNHVHLLRATRDGKHDQAIFDFSFTKAEIRFDPPTALETAIRQIVAGIARSAGGLVQILFLVALALAARSWSEAAALASMFLAGQAASAVLTPMTSWQPAPRFVEAAMALTVAYLAVEILALPKAGQRWLVAGVLGVFHGLYFALFLRTSEFRAVYVLSGAAASEIFLLALFTLALGKLRLLLPRVAQAGSVVLFGIGMAWFFVRLRG
ncbi:MAG: HupE/UreJ family protein [Candidatus Solibacter usitatus]|nr:HupE/UreJ family protein [Candidatus Solibacter usitatus]